MAGDKPLGGEHRIDVAVGLVLSVITLGLYHVYWLYRLFQAMNALLGREEFGFLRWLLFTVLTLGLYHVYRMYRVAEELRAWLAANGRPGSPNLPLIAAALTLFGLGPVAAAIVQHELNKLAA